MDCTGGLFSIIANGISDAISVMLPAVRTASTAVVLALVALVPAIVVLALAGKEESRKLASERRGSYHRK